MIYCERERQKGILVGKGGQMLKKIGTAARLQIEKMLGKRVFLELFVKVRKTGGSRTSLSKSSIGAARLSGWR